MARDRTAKRSFNPISLAFLDVMSCGFGAVVLIFLILDHSTTEGERTDVSPELAAEVNLLHEEIEEGEEGLVRIRNTISDVDFEMVEAQGLASRIEEEIDNFMDRLVDMQNTTSGEEAEIERLRNEIAAMEAEIQRLRAEEQEASGSSARRFIGEGSRQYLTGLILGGNRILVLVDVSASMLDDTIINILRRRNMSDEAKLNSQKWTDVRNVLDWLTSQLPIPSQYQIYAFNNETEPLVPGTLGQWLEVADQEQLDEAVENLKQMIPSNGTNLEQVFQAVQGLNPLPDNIYLITDGLPTLDSRTANSATVSGRERERVFERALQSLPGGIPVNVIMAPLEGDPMAASAYWRLAVATGGSFLSPSRDWP